MVLFKTTKRGSPAKWIKGTAHSKSKTALACRCPEIGFRFRMLFLWLPHQQNGVKGVKIESMPY